MTQSQRGSCCCFPVLAHPGVMFLLCINSPAFEFISFHDFQTWSTVSAFRGQSIHTEFYEFCSCHFLHFPGNSWVWVREVAALGAPGVCPCAITPAGDSCMAELGVTSFGLVGGTSAAAGIQIPQFWGEQMCVLKELKELC